MQRFGAAACKGAVGRAEHTWKLLALITTSGCGHVTASTRETEG